MILSTETFFALSTSSLSSYWDDEILPGWSRLRTLAYCPGQVMGYGAEPHYHDNDEFWFFTSGGRGEAWLDDERYDVGPNTMVYTPRGVVHRFQMFAPFANVGIRTRLEGQRRAAHLYVPDDGQPEPGDRGIVVPGQINTGPIEDRPARCPVSEMRVVTVGPGQPLAVEGDTVTYVLAVQGALRTSLDGLSIELAAQQQSSCSAYATATTPQGDLIVLRPQVSAMFEADESADVLFVRE